MLVCFFEEPESQVAAGGSIASADVPRVVELERELERQKNDLQNSIRNLEISGEVQMAVNEDALSVNEEDLNHSRVCIASADLFATIGRLAE